MAQSVERPNSAPVMISQFMSLSPTSGLLLSGQSLLRILCSPLPLPLPYLHSLKREQTLKKKKRVATFKGDCEA